MAKQFMLNPSRSGKQGTLINVSKDTDEYKKMVTTLVMNPADMESIGVAAGDAVVVRNEVGEAEFTCESGKVPEGMIFVTYGPPTCKLMGAETDGTGMPTSKGWMVDVVPVAAQN